MLVVSGVGGAVGHGIYVMCDKSKGSMTNRFECAKEHAKNDIKTGLQIGVPVAVVTGVGIAKPSILIKIAKATGNLLGKIAKKLGGRNLAEKILSKPGKAGAIGLALAGAAYIFDRILNYAFKSGQIDQKYTDAAKIESQTKNIVLEKNHKHVCTPDEIKEFYRKGGKGIYLC